MSRKRRGSFGSTAAATAGAGLMLGHHRTRLGKIDHLAASGADQLVALAQSRPATRTQDRLVGDDLVGVFRHLQGLARRSRLLAGLAALPALGTLRPSSLGLTLTFDTLRRLGGIPRVLGQLRFQRRHLGGQTLVVFHQPQHQRHQLALRQRPQSLGRQRRKRIARSRNSKFSHHPRPKWWSHLNGYISCEYGNVIRRSPMPAERQMRYGPDLNEGLLGAATALISLCAICR